MNNLREAVGELFQSPVQNMNYVAYMQYINTAGKITARSLMDIITILLTYTEELEKKNEQYEDNFKQIEEILQKLVNRKTMDQIMDGEETVKSILKHTPETINETPELQIPSVFEFKCETCGKTAKNKIGLIAHKRTHAQK